MRNELFEFEGEQGSRLIGKLDLPDGPPHSYALFAHCFTWTKESLAAVRIGRALAGQGIGVRRVGAPEVVLQKRGELGSHEAHLRHELGLLLAQIGNVSAQAGTHEDQRLGASVQQVSGDRHVAIGKKPKLVVGGYTSFDPTATALCTG